LLKRLTLQTMKMWLTWQSLQLILKFMT